MKTREQNLRYLKAQLTKYDNDGLAFINDAIEEGLSSVDVADDNGLLLGNLSAGVGENKSMRWFARNKGGGESFENIAQDTYDNADTIEDTVHLVTTYIEEEATSTDQ